MRAGDLRHRVVIQSPSYSASTQSGQGVASFSTLATVWAAVRPLSGSERLTTGAVTSEVSYEIEIRQRSDVTPGMRVQWTPYSGSALTLEVLAALPSATMADRMTLTCGVTQ